MSGRHWCEVNSGLKSVSLSSVSNCSAVRDELRIHTLRRIEIEAESEVEN